MDSEGVTAVVGTLLIVGVLILAAVGVMYWGIPAVRELRDRDTFDHVSAQAAQFNQELRGLVLKGDAQNAARSVLRIPDGTLGMTRGHRVVVAFMLEAPDFAQLPESQLYTKPYNVSFHGWGDDATDGTFDVKNVGRSISTGAWGVHNARFTVYQVAGDAQTVKDGPDTVSFPKGARHVVSLGASYDMSGKVIRVVGENVSALGVATQFLEAWIMDAGALEYALGAGSDVFGFSLENGALLLERKGDTFVDALPLVQFPDRQVNKETFTWRFLQLNGTAGAGGSGAQRYPFFLSLAQNANRMEGPAASIVRLYVNGTNEVAWWNLLEGMSLGTEKIDTNPDHGLVYERKPNSESWEPFRVKLVHSEILVRVTPGD